VDTCSSCLDGFVKNHRYGRTLGTVGPTIFSPGTHVHRGDRHALVHLPHFSSISVVGVVQHHGPSRILPYTWIEFLQISSIERPR
jgi:hypothetical protein